MTYQEAIDYIENFTWSKTRLGLERTKELLARLGNPQKQLKFVHVTGSNGKGSTCAMLDSVLRKSGYTTGLYTSPYVCEFNERIRVNGENISKTDLASITAEVKVMADAMEDHPSQFELVTAIAFVYFQRMHCDIVVLEVGMGGALDSTNAIDAPLVAAFTNIGLEHTEYLGSTIEEIASTKGGIIKPGCSVVCYDSDPRSNAVIENICKEKKTNFRLADFSLIQPLSHDLSGQRFVRKGIGYTLPLLGKHQLYNAEVVFEIIEELKKLGYEIDDRAVYEGMSEVRWMARFDVLSTDPVFILDGGHNPQCAKALRVVLDDYLPDGKLTFLVGILADKNYSEMIDAVSGRAARFICVTPDSPRALEAEALAKVIKEKGFPALTASDVDCAVEESFKYPEPVIAFGSLYMAGDVLRIMKKCHHR